MCLAARKYCLPLVIDSLGRVVLTPFSAGCDIQYFFSSAKKTFEINNHSTFSHSLNCICDTGVNNSKNLRS